MPVGESDARAFERCVAGGGVALFPADTVYGLATHPESEDGVRRIHELKGRPPAKPSAVMFFSLEAALAALPDLGPRTRAALERLLPGPVTLVVPNPGGRFPLACGPDIARVGVRVPALPRPLSGLERVAVPVLQTSANRSGEPDARRLRDVPAEIWRGVDLALDGGELPGTPSTVVDLGAYEERGEHAILRAGALDPAEVRARLGG
jgi:L-threonylcarbamoyladenylate synthase